MHFFTEPAKLDTQANTDTFGPLFGSEVNIYRISSKHKVLTGSSAKVFACQDSMMLVVPTIDFTTKAIVPGRVNLILKPLDSLLIPLQPISYYIIRGLDRNSFLSGAAIIADDIAVNSEFINKFHFNWNLSLPIRGLAPGTVPDPRVIGFHEDLATNLTYRAYWLEEFFNSSASTNTFIQDFAAVKVREGEWIGNVLAGNEFEFEIVTDTENMPINLEYAEYNAFQIDATLNPINPANVTLTALTAREKVLNYIDPAAFFGMHFEGGVRLFSAYTNSGAGNNPSNTTAPVLKRKLDLVTEILAKFINKDVVYLDVRSERGYSYGFYQNYRDSSDDILRLKSKSDLLFHNLDYKAMPWPLVNLKNPPTNLNAIDPGAPIYLKLSIRDNKTPVLFAEDPKLFGEKNKKQFFTKKELVDDGLLGSDDFTETIKLFIPFVTISSVKSNVSWHIKLQYFRELNDIDSPTSVFKVDNYLDSTFGGINNQLLSVPTTFNHVQNTKRQFVNGGSFSFVTDTGIYFESGTVPTVMFYSELAFSQSKSSSFYPKINLSSITNEGILKRKNVIYNKVQVTVDAVNVDLLQIVGYNRTSNETTPEENLHLLGLTKAEWDAIIAATTSLDGHQIYLKFIEQTVTTSTKTCRKFKLVARGLSSSMVVTEITSFGGTYPEIIVYGTKETMLCSKDFAAVQNVAPNLPDPAKMTEFEDAHHIEYTGSHPDVNSLFTDGKVTLVDDSSQNVGGMGFSSAPNANLVGDLFLPVDNVGDTTISIKGTPYPLIVICHGNGQRYTDYRTLAKFLAQNGFIVASISNLAFNNVTLFEAKSLSSITFSPPYTPTSDEFLIRGSNYIDTIYIFDRATDKLSVLAGGWSTGSAFSWTDKRDLSWKNNAEFVTYIKPQAKIWTRTGTAAAANLTSFGIKWLTNSGPTGSRKADLKKDSASRLVELTAANYTMETFADVKSVIISATDVSEIKIPYPSTSVDKYIGIVTGDNYYMIHIISSSVSGTTVTLNVEIKNAQLEFKLAIGQHGLGILGRANMLYPHLQIIKKITGADVQNNVGLLGHSRGAESVVRSATDLTASGTIPRFDIIDPSLRTGSVWKNVPSSLDQINAVASLTPTDQINKNGTTSSAIAYPAVRIGNNIPYYVLYGSMEGDVEGIPNTTRKNRNSGFSIYDRSLNGTEKAMSFVYGASHNGFITDDHDYRGKYTDFLSSLMDLTKQKNIAKGYFNAFMRMHLKGESYWAPYFYGDAIPISAQDDHVYQQYRNMSTPSGKWLEDFSGSTLPDAELSGTVIIDSTSAVLSRGDMIDFKKTTNAASPHDTKGMYVDWTTTSNVLKVNVDKTTTTAVKDATPYDYISFRIGHVVDLTSGYAYEDLSKVKIKLADLSGVISERLIDRPVPEPFKRQNRLIKSAMMTVRLPLSSFTGAADLATIKFVYFEFPGTGTVIMDDLEFTD